MSIWVTLDQYILQFHTNTTKTFFLDTAKKCHGIININNYNPNFKILNNTIRSIIKNINEFLVILEQFHRDIDCIVLPETRTAVDKSLFNIPGYNILYKGSAYNQINEVIIFIKNLFGFPMRMYSYIIIWKP